MTLYSETETTVVCLAYHLSVFGILQVCELIYAVRYYNFNHNQVHTCIHVQSIHIHLYNNITHNTILTTLLLTYVCIITIEAYNTFAYIIC